MSRTQKMVTITVLTAISILFHMIKLMIPVLVSVSGFKPGLANIVGLTAYYLFGAKVMLSVDIMRVVLASLLRGMLFDTGLWLLMCDILLLTLACILTRGTPMSIYGVSVAGNSTRAIEQVIAVALIYQQFFMQAILPVLILLGIPTGLFVAYIAKTVLKRIHIE